MKTVNRVYKKNFFTVLSVLTAVLLCLTAFSGLQVAKAEESGNPSHMLIISDGGYKEFYQMASVEQNTTYVYSFNYYCEEANQISALIRDNNWASTHRTFLSNGLNNFSVEYTTDGDDPHLFFMIDSGVSGTAYIWNVSVVKKGTTENLLENGDFSKGTLGGWTVGSTAYPIDTTETSTNNFSVVPYDGSLWSSDGDNKQYMLAVYDKDPEGNSGQYKDFTQRITGLQANTTYIFSFDYFSYNDTSTVVKIIKDDWSEDVKPATLLKGLNHMSVSYTTGEGETAAYFGIESGGSGTAYIWDITVVKNNTTANLIKNGDFATGSLANWNVAGQAFASNSTTDKHVNFAVVEYDSSIWKTDKKYMLKQEGYYSDEDDNVKTWCDFLQLVYVEPNTTYVFTFDYFADEYMVDATGRIKNEAYDDAADNYYFEKGRNSATLEYTTTSDDRLLYFGFNGGTDGTTYIWNLSAVKKGTTENILKNADFEFGTLASWRVAAHALSDRSAISSLLNYSVVEFDDSLLQDEEDTEPEDPEDPDTEDPEPTEKPAENVETGESLPYFVTLVFASAFVVLVASKKNSLLMK